ncbi:MAG: hypothetical protein HQK51_13835 [Oligoflexia bacterium]|nr:hypothetical protein [Oligoflexia bacterium]
MKYYLIHEQDVCDIWCRLEEYLSMLLDDYEVKNSEYEDEEYDDDEIAARVKENESNLIANHKNDSSLADF